MKHEVFIIDGARTPFLKAKGTPGDESASHLAVNASKALLKRHSFLPSEIDEVIIGCMMPSPDEANIARVIALRSGCGTSVPAWTVQRNCASGMQAIDSAYRNIAGGYSNLVLAGGTEAMSRAPLLFNNNMVQWISNLNRAKTPLQKLKSSLRFRPNFLAPIIALLRGLTDSTINLNMGQTAEIVAYRFGISRTQMDEFALTSHKRAAAASDENHFTSLTPTYTNSGKVFCIDDGIRRDSSLEKLASLKPFFDKKFGNVTAGNSSQVTDGAALLILANKQTVEKYNLPVQARIRDVVWSALDPAEMGLGPVYASTTLLQRNNLQLQDIDFWEINEAFAAQVLGCMAAWDSESYCKEFLGLSKAWGLLDQSKLNIDGGAIALGHPVGASGARIVLQLMHVLQRKQARLGVATICIGGGQGGAMLIENLENEGV